jgi:hypothetical protein
MTHFIRLHVFLAAVLTDTYEQQRNSRAGALSLALIMMSKYHEIDLLMYISEKARARIFVVLMTDLPVK